MKKQFFRHLVCGGTFDHFHQGHRHFLSTAFALAKKVTIGLTDYNSYQKPYAESIEGFSSRKEHLEKFIKTQQASKVSIVPIKDPFGPSVLGDEFDTILITKNTLKGAYKVNKQRQILGLKPLQIHACDLKKPFSSRLIRKGIMLPDLAEIKITDNLALRQANRRYFKKPLGKLIKSSNQLDWPAKSAGKIIEDKKPPFTAIVGDIALHSFERQNIDFDLAVIDNKSRRQKINKGWHSKSLSQSQIFESYNLPGTISKDFFQTAEKAIFSSQKSIIKVQGEEDLTVLPLILRAPLDSLIFYGQPKEGLVMVKVTVAKKIQVLNLLKHFRSA